MEAEKFVFACERGLHQSTLIYLSVTQSAVVLVRRRPRGRRFL